MMMGLRTLRDNSADCGNCNGAMGPGLVSSHAYAISLQYVHLLHRSKLVE